MASTLLPNDVREHFIISPAPEGQKGKIATCKWCKRARSDNISRQKKHLLQQCAAYAAAHSPQKQATIRDNFFKATKTPQRQRELHKKFAKACFIGGRPFNVFEGEEMADAFRALDSSFAPPDRHRVASFVDEVYDDTLQEVKQYFDTAKHLNLVFDGSDDVAFNRVINLSVEVPGQAAFFWETIDTKATPHSALDQIDLLLPSINRAVDGDLSKVNAVCTDTNTTQRKCQSDLKTQPGLEHLIGILCDSHSLQLLVKDIVTTSPWRVVLEKAVYVITYFRHSKKQYARLRDLMPSTCNGKKYSLLLAAITRWGSQQRALQSIERVKAALLVFCTDRVVLAEAGIQNFPMGTSEPSNDPESANQLRKVLDILNDRSFWRGVTCLLAILEPITSAQKQSETDRAYVHRVVPRWLHIRKQWQDLENTRQWHDVDWLRLYSQFDTRFAKQTTDVHWAAFSFDPESFAPGALTRGQKERAMQWVEDHAPPPLRDEIVTEYVQFRMGQGRDYGPGSSFRCGNQPIEEKWDRLAALGVPLAQHVVTRLFRALANSVPSERSFSAANFIHSKTRNRLQQPTVNKLTFIYVNSRVLQQLRLAPKTTRSSSSLPPQWSEWMDLEARFLEGEQNVGDHGQDLLGHYGLTTHPDDLSDPSPSLPVPGTGQLSSSTQLSVGRDNWSQNTLIWGQSVSWEGLAGLAHQSAAQKPPVGYPDWYREGARYG